MSDDVQGQPIHRGFFKMVLVKSCQNGLMYFQQQWSIVLAGRDSMIEQKNYGSLPLRT